MADDSFRNTAGRVLNLLRTAAQYNRNDSCRKCWASVCGCNASDTAEIFGKLLLLRFALDRIHHDVQRCPQIRSGNVLLPKFANIFRAISPNNLDESWNEYLRYLVNGELVALEVIANELDPEDEIPAEELREIETLTSKLFNKIRESNLEAPLKYWSLDLLESLRRSLQEYKIRGAEGIEKAISSIIGELIRHAADLQPQKNNPWLQEFWQLVVKIDATIDRALKSRTLRLGYRAIKATVGLPDFLSDSSGPREADS